jgi:uncharacterized protein (TIGR02996 family)
MSAAQMVDSFLRDILDHPFDDAPRLIYADWLEDHGEEARAEFIRVQCELARGVFPCECTCEYEHGIGCPAGRKIDLRRREREVEGWADEWARAILPPLASYWMPRRILDSNPELTNPVFAYHRGFVAEVTLPCAAWVGRECPDCLDRYYGQHGRWWEHCLSCHGSGQVDDGGGSLVEVTPLEWVDLADKRPFRSTIIERSVCWVRIREGGLGGGGIPNHGIPPELFDLLEDGSVVTIDDQPAFRVYHGVTGGCSERENPALQDLSRACLKLFKDK